MNTVQWVSLFFIGLHYWASIQYSTFYFRGELFTEREKSRYRFFSILGYVSIIVFLLWSI